MTVKTYRVIESFSLGNAHHGKGVLLHLTDAQAANMLHCELIALEPADQTGDMNMKTYRVIRAFTRGNLRHDEDTLLKLTGQQAIYLLEGGFIKPEPAPDTPQPAGKSGTKGGKPA